MISSRLLHGALAIFLFVAWPLVSLAQNHSLKGVVKDQLSNPVQGASVSIKGSDKSMGTTTLEDGSFNLQLPAAVGSIEVTIVGYKNKTVAVKEGSSIVVQLQESTSQLAEVVMIGYGTQKKSNLTGAVASISNKDFKNQPLSNLANSIQGKLSGINVTSPSGTPGAGLLVSIRGAQNPLYVVDGIPMLSESNSSLSTSFNTTGEEVGQGQNISSISDINPDDIES
ncbi:TonB-dependent receptor plug domain-containing protein, partial [Ferruginibacter sp.]|uniref:carboxypeptidase-like regulatory domain-containing protein n=1 Tax=Ferruginibacter sp. TaxID=1940288 RepID=UPI00199F86BD